MSLIPERKPYMEIPSTDISDQDLHSISEDLPDRTCSYRPYRASYSDVPSLDTSEQSWDSPSPKTPDVLSEDGGSLRKFGGVPGGDGPVTPKKDMWSVPELPQYSSKRVLSKSTAPPYSPLRNFMNLHPGFIWATLFDANPGAHRENQAVRLIYTVPYGRHILSEHHETDMSILPPQSLVKKRSKDIKILTVFDSNDGIVCSHEAPGAAKEQHRYIVSRPSHHLSTPLPHRYSFYPSGPCNPLGLDLSVTSQGKEDRKKLTRHRWPPPPAEPRRR